MSLYGFDRVVVQNQAERKGVIGVQQEREPLVSAHVVEGGVGQGLDVGVELWSVLFQPLVIDLAVWIDGGLQEFVQHRVVEGRPLRFLRISLLEE